MVLIDTIISFIQRLDKQQFYRYLGGAVAGILIVIGSLGFVFYRYSANLTKQIKIATEQQDEIVDILSASAMVKQQQEAVDTVLDQDKQFKIAGYFNQLLRKHKLSENKTVETTSQIELDDKYRQSILNVQFTTITMKALCELLNEIEQKERIATKSLEVRRSQKESGTIDVNLTIATLQTKTVIQDEEE